MKKNNIALVEIGTPAVHVFSRAYLPRVGIATMGAILAENNFDCDLYFAPKKKDIDKLFQYDIVGIGALSNTITEAYRIAVMLKQKNIKVIMGGPHVSFMPEEAIEYCDYVVIGEGDNTLLTLCNSIKNNTSCNSIKGLVYKNSNGMITNTGFPDVVEYKNLPSPDFMLSPEIRKSGKIPPIVVTSRGCPHNCSFCSVTPIFGKAYRFKTNEQVILELNPVLDRSVCFGDDNFCANPKRTKSLLRDMIKKNSIPLRWAGQMCVKSAEDNELLDLMQETRCRIVYVGIESVAAGTLTDYGKNHKIEDIKKCVNNLHKHNIGVHGMFVVNINDEVNTPDQIVDFAIENDIDTIQICSLTPFPGAESYKELEDKLLHKKWEYFNGMYVVAQPEKCSAYDMQIAIINSLRRFYSLRRVLNSYRRNRGWRLKYRLGGYLLLKKWLQQNEKYIRLLKGINNN